VDIGVAPSDAAEASALERTRACNNVVNVGVDAEVAVHLVTSSLQSRQDVWWLGK
jgi:hypothetical protein